MTEDEIKMKDMEHNVNLKKLGDRLEEKIKRENMTFNICKTLDELSNAEPGTTFTIEELCQRGGIIYNISQISDANMTMAEVEREIRGEEPVKVVE